MTSLNDAHAWLSTPGGHIFVAQCGGYSQALNAIITANTRELQDAYQANQARLMNGLAPLDQDAAIHAVRDHSGPFLAGDAEAIRASCHDPAWRVGVTTDDSESTATRWEPRSLAFINSVRATRDQEPLPG